MKDLKTVKSILEKHYRMDKNPTFFFGSRALGTNREDSDLDILIDDKSISPETVTFLEEAFEESPLLYKVDIVLKSRIDEDFFNKIKNDLKTIG